MPRRPFPWHSVVVAVVVLLAAGVSTLLGFAAVKALRQPDRRSVKGKPSTPPRRPPQPSPQPPPQPPPPFIDWNDYAASCRWFAAQDALLKEKGEGEALDAALKERNDRLAKEVGQKVNWQIAVWDVKSVEGQGEVSVFLNPYGAFRTIPPSGPAFLLKADREWVSKLKHGDIIRLRGEVRSAKFLPPMFGAPLNSLIVEVDPYTFEQPSSAAGDTPDGV